MKCPHTSDDLLCSVCLDLLDLRDLVADMREWQVEHKKTGLEHSAKEERKSEKKVDKLLKKLQG